jgi:hypothetical protein
MMSIRVKIKVTVPSKLLSFYTVREEIKSAMKQETAPKLKTLFRKTVQGWKNPPDFAEELTENFAMIAIKVFATGPNDTVYKFVNDGTKPHPISPINKGGMLVFRSGYNSSTKPWSLNSRANSRFGDTVGMWAVRHPGFGGRYFDVQIADMSGDEFVKDMEDAIHLAIVSTTSSTGGI